VTARRPLPSRLAGPQDSPGLLLWKVSNAWQRRQRAALKPFGLTHAQFVLLAASAWYGADEVLTQARLAELSGVDVMTTSQIVRTLQAAGLITRAAHPSDPRANALTITKAGRAIAKKAIVAVEDVDAAFFAAAPSHSALLTALQALSQASARE
jgi:MarR family transcriptional regulator, organic hydroperoxide resistance regulator